MYPIKVNGAKACTVVDRITGRTLESAWHSIGEENRCVIAKLGWLSKRDSGKLYGSMVVYLASKSQADKFLAKELFEVGEKAHIQTYGKNKTPEIAAVSTSSDLDIENKIVQEQKYVEIAQHLVILMINMTTQLFRLQIVKGSIEPVTKVVQNLP